MTNAGIRTKGSLMTFRFLVLALSALFLSSPALSRADVDQSDTETTSANWLLRYEGKSTNAFVWDKRATALVNTRVPPTLSRDVLNALGGPPDPVVVVDGRYVSVSACRPHSCTEKGFLWVDTKTGTGLGAYHSSGTLRLGSNGIAADRIPVQARQALISWLSEQDLQTESAEFIGRSGERTKLQAKDFGAQEKFHAPSTGPAFDCRLAASDIEKTICADETLSAQDLALSELYNRIRLGSGTTIAQGQVRTLQRNWLKNRDRECAHASNVAACLKDQYTAQYDRLNHWVPASGTGVQ
jgi:uncharacterized protein YecT (DUF1311 family)